MVTVKNFVVIGCVFFWRVRGVKRVVEGLVLVMIRGVRLMVVVGVGFFFM